MTKTTDEELFYHKTRQPLSSFIMFKCCVSGAKEDVEDAKKARAKKDPKQSHPPPSAATSTTATAAAAGDDGGRSVMSNASGVGGVCLSSAPLVGLDRGENVVSGASGAYLFSYYMTYLFVGC